ncbi:hypothetical protein BD324DRAFT_619223 [Kockovaella imperatae]|uniref:GLTSCR protein conserved domain-containing protein n=1 Tax=Kockovaella imperatae TaxID=4999 RepID=A0A1Y1UMN2_9TREE|nr:hypothetical protein BD324DRAFT_619223 [Kockovaella imperatae]ORX39310.1 hypothetical protein BD324DRAFT_619223 [Kockovaella imperatae]
MDVKPSVTGSSISSTHAPQAESSFNLESNGDVQKPNVEPRVKVETDSGNIDRVIEDESVRRKRKWSELGYTAEEIRTREKAVLSYQLALLQDQQATLFPSAPTAFTSYHDVVDRLIPYHIWQIPDEELDGGDPSTSAKDKQRVQRDIFDARVLTGVMNKARDRFTRVKRREGMFPSDLPSVINLIKSSTSQIREELDAVQSSLRMVKMEYDVLETARRSRERLTSSSFHAPNISLPVAPASTSARPMSTPAGPLTNTTTTTSSSSSFSTTTAAPTAIPPSVSTATSTSSTPERGRGRGRPRGSGRGGHREPVTSHLSTPTQSRPAVQATGKTPAPTPSTPSAITGTPSVTAASTSSTTPSAAAPKTGAMPVSAASKASTTPGEGSSRTKDPNAVVSALKPGQPLKVTVAGGAISHLAKLGIVNAGENFVAAKGQANPPAVVISKSADGSTSTLSLDLSKCTPHQHLILAKVLKIRLDVIQSSANASRAASAATGSPSMSKNATPAKAPATTISASAASAGAKTSTNTTPSKAQTPTVNAAAPAASDPSKRTRAAGNGT